MRQLHVQVRADKGQRVMELANEHQAFSPTSVQAMRPDGDEWRMIFVNLPNDQIGGFIDSVESEVEDAQFVIIPRGSLPINTPLGTVHQRLRDVSHRSTLELVVDSLQSVGSWKGTLLYALFSGVVAAYGAMLNTSYLLVAAMLIAPMGAPIMVAVIGTAIGDLRMFGRGALRFFLAILVLIGSAAVVGYAYGLSISTALMEQITGLSEFTVLVALVAGAAGAQSQVQSDRSSLVTGTATGFLVAAALSPPAAVLGLSIPLQRWDYAALMAFLLALQFFALVTGGWLALWLYDVRPQDTSTGRGSQRWRAALTVIAAAATAGLVWWQIQRGPTYLKADLARDATRLARVAIQNVPSARLIEASAHFTRRDLPVGRNEALLVSIIAERTVPSVPSDSIEAAIRAAVKQRIRSNMQDVVPLVDVSVIPGEIAP